MSVKDAVLDELKRRLLGYENLYELENGGFANIRHVLDVVGGPLPGDQLGGLLTKNDAMLLLADYLVEWDEIRRAFVSGEREEVFTCHYYFGRSSVEKRK